MKSLCVASSVLLVLASSVRADNSALHSWHHGNSPHTWHHVSVTDQASWKGRLVITSASEPAFFTDRNGKSKGETYDFTLNKKTSPFIYGFGFKSGTDFNVSYTLTLYQSAGRGHGPLKGSFFTAKGCQFNVSAKGPAQPDVRVEKYNSATCSFTVVPGQGENFTAG